MRAQADDVEADEYQKPDSNDDKCREHGIEGHECGSRRRKRWTARSTEAARSPFDVSSIISALRSTSYVSSRPSIRFAYIQLRPLPQAQFAPSQSASMAWESVCPTSIRMRSENPRSARL